MYIYTVYMKWKAQAKEKGPEFFMETWFPQHDEVCSKYGVKLLRWGLPMGVTEDHVYIYETAIEAKTFLDFKGEISSFEGELLWEYSRTQIAVIPE